MPERVAEIKLELVTNERGAPRVKRIPNHLHASRRQVDFIRLTNADSRGTEISVIVKPQEAKALFDPVPAEKVTLKPGEFVDWALKPTPGPDVTLNFRTVPANIDGGDHADIHVEC